ncbi:protein DOG1-like 4 [Populus nigra]|uniref:protein DOG1-like 4 n=1 Tax=Populus nigra TaxID=3691 RepID=UPI002B27A82F|nr:protein DOG1-like 4 [Populus nigra]
MSKLPSSAAYLVSTLTNGSLSRETFRKFFECWLAEQNNYLEQLISTCKDYDHNKKNSPQSSQATLQPLINRVLEHYEHYYRAKSRWAKDDVLSMLSPSWTSTLEHAFLWIGGWRPSVAFHLLYSKSGHQLEAQLHELICGLGTGDLGDLSASQLTRVDQLQRKTIREENELTEKLAKHQETVADSSMVELAHEVTELLRSENTGDEVEEERVESTLAPKKDGLQEILQMADDLRVRTIKGVVEILTPIQAVHFLIAAAELHLRLHDWGKKGDWARRVHH